MKRKNKERIQVCPQCGSPDIQTDFSNAAAVVRGFLETKICNHCSHTGTFFPSISIKQLKKPFPKTQVKNINHFDKTFARGVTNTLFGIVGLFCMLIAISSFVYGAPLAGFINLALGALAWGALALLRKNSKD